MSRKNSLGELTRLLKARKKLAQDSQEMRKHLEQLAPFMPTTKQIKRSSEGNWTSCAFGPWKTRKQNR